MINIIVVKHYDSNAEVIDCSNIVWALHAMLVDNEVSLDRINKIINDVEVNRKNVCRILYFIYLCKIKLYIDRYLVFDYSNLYERIKQKKEFTQLRCYSTLINEIEDFQRLFDVKYMLQVSGNTALPTEAIIKTEGMIKDIDYSVKQILR